MTEYYCMAVGENVWTRVEAPTLDMAAVNYVKSSPVLSDFTDVSGVDVFVKWNVDSTVFKFNVTSDYEAFPIEKY